MATGALVGLLRQLKIAQDEHASANPPRLAGRQATLYFERIFSEKPSTEKEPFGEVYVFNYGNNDAIVASEFNAADKPPTFANIVVYVGRHPPINRPFDDAKFANPLRVENSVLRAGGSKWWPIHDVSMVDLPTLEAAWKRRSKDNIYIIGRVHYADTRGVQRHMVFCRVYDRKTRRFLPSGDTEYEYVT
ncbi:MAG: hypothetical protein M9939_13290 [Mesorhizobium sp.]|nr:hypothetical protein [Mesorhizobium sp.]MCO5162107.1 hypothetical protein [Mesorhizobium sp.]